MTDDETDKLLDDFQKADVYTRTREAIKEAEVLGTVKLAEAITTGLYDWTVLDKSQVDLMLEVMCSLADQTGKPIEVVNKTEEHNK